MPNDLIKEKGNVSGVEIFAVGTWNGEAYTEQDLNEIISAFEDNKETLKPFLKLGHNDSQDLLKQDGLPAAGWIENLRMVGTKLVADFVDIPDKIFQLLKNKAYRKVSSEIYHNIKINGKSYKRFLSGVALLGGDLPAVTSLDDILSLYGISDFKKVSYYSDKENLDVRIYDYINQGKESTMTEKTNEKEVELKVELTQMKDENKTIKHDLSELFKANEASETELKELREFKLDAQKKIDEAVKNEKRADFVKNVNALETTKAVKEYLIDSTDESKETYTKAEKLFTEDQLKETLKLHLGADVNLEENSEAKEFNLDDEDKTVKKVAKYQEENKCTYREAYDAIVG